MMGISRRSSLSAVSSFADRASNASANANASRHSSSNGNGRRPRGVSRAVFVGVPVFILLALSAFGENGSRRARANGRDVVGSGSGSGTRAARRFGGDEAVARLRATATATVDYEPRAETTGTKTGRMDGVKGERTLAPTVVAAPKEDDDDVTTKETGTGNGTGTGTGNGTGTGTGTDARRYAVVIDAGSTGSRVHVFAFQTVDDGLKLLEDTFEATKPGLSAKAEDPKGAADSLRRLMDVAVKTVPESARATTSAEIRATAGLRLLPGDASKNILAECVKMLGDYPFKFDPAASVSIMDGADEGAFQWLTMNYLLGNLKGAGLTTTAIFTPWRRWIWAEVRCNSRIKSGKSARRARRMATSQNSERSDTHSTCTRARTSVTD